MKKILSFALVLVLVLSLGATAFAEGVQIDPKTYQDISSVTITKTFKLKNDGVSPAEIFSFTTLTCDSVTDAAAGVTKDNAPVPTIGTVGFAEGAATTAGATATATINLPTYTSVGVYTYKFKEAVPTTKTAGITYNQDDLYLVVTVLQGPNGKLRVAAVHCEGTHDKGTYNDGTKKDSFTNTYENGSLVVKKTVTGNLGDKTKYFKVDVTFTAPDGVVVKSPITYSGGQYTTDQAVPNTNTVTIEVKDGDTVTFANVPKDAIWTVKEKDYTNDGYTTKYDGNQAENATGNISAGAEVDECAIENNKEVTVDTGITLDSLPYILIVAVVLAASVVMIVNKRRSEV